jgi:lipoprotein NlpD
MANGQAYEKLTVLILLLVVLAGCTSIGTPVVSERSKGAALNAAGEYVVRKGDTLYSIAWLLDMDYQTLATANNISDPYVIFPNQQLRLKAKPKARVAAVTINKTAVKSATTKPSVGRDSISKSNRDKAISKQARTIEKPTKPKAIRRLSPKWSWPVRQKPITVFGKGSNGLDYAVSRRTNVMSAGLGKVVYAGNGIAGFERLVIIKHSGNLLSAYSFNGRLLVEEEQAVDSLIRVAEILPRPGVGQKLHFELRRNGKPINPMTVIRQQF